MVVGHNVVFPNVRSLQQHKIHSKNYLRTVFKNVGTKIFLRFMREDLKLKEFINPLKSNFKSNP